MHRDYQNPIMRQFSDQVCRALPEWRVVQANRAEKLMEEIDTSRQYTYEYLVYRITNYRPDSPPHVVMAGESVLHDLQLFVEDVFASAEIRASEMGEQVLTAEELAEQFGVSTTTISRWRSQGLVARRFLFEGGRKRVGFLRSSVERFVARNAERVRRGSSFSKLSEAERVELVERARCLAQAGGCPSEVARRVAGAMNRSVETVRYTLKQFDAEHPELAVFPDHSGPLTAALKESIYRRYRDGASVDDLAEEFSRTRTTIYRVVNEVRAGRIAELPLDHIYNEEFEDSSLEEEILAPMPEASAARRSRPPAGLPPYLAALYEVPLLTAEQERHLFRQLNYLKFRAHRLREGLDPAKAKSSVMDEIERLYEAAVAVKNRIVQANLRLVVSIAKRHLSGPDEFFELVSDGNMSLIRAVEKFDYSRGNKFSTYASWAIMKNYARTIPDGLRRRDRYRTSHEELFGATEDARTDPRALEAEQARRERQVLHILSRLDEREQRIIISRFGLDHGVEPLTLKEVGDQMGVTKERVRQIEARALNKLRIAAAEEHIDSPE